MKKILLIIQREYLSRVKKKSFIVMTILGPLLICALYAIPFAAQKITAKQYPVAVIDETGFYYNKLNSTGDVRFLYKDDLTKATDDLATGIYSAVLHIPISEYGLPTHARLLYAKEQPGIPLQTGISSQMQLILQDHLIFTVCDIPEKEYKDILNKKIDLRTEDILTGKSSFVELKTVLGILMGALIFSFIFMFGSLVMAGVMEEKTNRVVEIIVSSVRPFQLMMGKIVGVALVGLTQFFIWVVFSTVLLGGLQFVFTDAISEISSAGQMHTLTQRIPTADMLNAAPAKAMPSEFLSGLLSIDFSVIIFSFFLYFLFGYLFYATLFAAIGSIIENQGESQQFTFPITILLMVSLLLFPVITQNPSGGLALWFSMIPFTSPVTMLMRIPFGVPIWQIVLSIAILILSFIGSTWLSAKIYRTGILMYGKKITYAELWKWIKYKG